MLIVGTLENVVAAAKNLIERISMLPLPAKDAAAISSLAQCAFPARRLNSCQSMIEKIRPSIGEDSREHPKRFTSHSSSAHTFSQRTRAPPRRSS